MSQGYVFVEDRPGYLVLDWEAEVRRLIREVGARQVYVENHVNGQIVFSWPFRGATNG